MIEGCCLFVNLRIGTDQSHMVELHARNKHFGLQPSGTPKLSRDTSSSRTIAFPQRAPGQIQFVS